MEYTNTITSENIFEKGLLINLKMGAYQGRKKLSQEQLKGLPTEIVRGVYDIFEEEFKKLLQEIYSHDMETRGRVKDMSVPFPIDGVYFLLSKAVMKATEFLKKRKIERDELIAIAANNYEDAIEKFAEKYPEYYREARAKYPSQNGFMDKYHFSYQLFTIAKPNENLEFVSSDAYKDEIVKFKNDVETMKREVIGIIYSELLGKVQQLKKQCTDGKPSQRTLNNLDKFFMKIDEVYSDFIDRKDIKETISLIKAQITGVDAKGLRESSDFKKEFKEGMAKALESIKNLPDIELTRSLEF